MSTAIINIQIVTMDAHASIIPHGYIIFTAEGIIQVVSSMETFAATKKQLNEPLTSIIDGKECIAMPGMVNTHGHFPMIPFRGLGDDTPDRLRRFLLPMEAKFVNKELVYAAAKYGLMESLRSGVTTVLDMYYFEDQVLRAAQDLSIRGVFCPSLMEEATPDFATPQQALAWSEQFIKEHHATSSSLQCAGIAPHATNTCSKDTLMKANNLSLRYNCPITLHASEMDYELEYFRTKYHSTPIEFLGNIGLLSNRLIAAHCIHLTAKDLQLIKQTNTSIAHCIGSNTKAGKGVAPIKEAWEKGISVGLGTDGPSSGNTLDMFAQFKLFASFHKTINKDRSLFPSKEIVRLGTMGGAKVLHMDKSIGSLEKGKCADIVLVETTSVNMYPLYDLHSALVYSANMGNVSDVFIAGKHLVSQKQLTFCDQKSIRSDLTDAMKDFRAYALSHSTDV